MSSVKLLKRPDNLADTSLLNLSVIAVSSSSPDRSRLRQSLAALREQYDGLQLEFKKHRERHDSQINSLNEDIDALVNEKMKMIEENRKTFSHIENEHIRQTRELRVEKEELEDQKHSVELVSAHWFASWAFR